MAEIKRIILTPSGQLNMVIQGHPTAALNKGHNLASIILGNHKWRFDEIHFYPPGMNDLASTGTLEITAFIV